MVSVSITGCYLPLCVCVCVCVSVLEVSQHHQWHFISHRNTACVPVSLLNSHSHAADHFITNNPCLFPHTHRRTQLQSPKRHPPSLSPHLCHSLCAHQSAVVTLTACADAIRTAREHRCWCCQVSVFLCALSSRLSIHARHKRRATMWNDTNIDSTPKPHLTLPPAPFPYSYLSIVTPALLLYSVHDCVDRYLISQGVVKPSLIIASMCSALTPLLSWYFVSYTDQGLEGAGYAYCGVQVCVDDRK